MTFDQRKATERVGRLERRLKHLEGRIETQDRSANALGWDRSEVSALRFAIRVCKLAISNWPAGMAAVADEEASERDRS